MPPKLLPPASLKILVVDDEEPVRLILEAILIISGHKVGLASDGPAAIEKFHSESWDVVLIDRQMPDMPGEEFARLLRALSPQTPVIMVTGCPPAHGCPDVDEIVLKPFTLATITAAIQRCVRAGAAGAGSVEGEVSAAA